MFNNIFFSYAADSPDAYKAVSGEAAARKSASQVHTYYKHIGLHLQHHLVLFWQFNIPQDRIFSLVLGIARSRSKRHV